MQNILTYSALNAFRNCPQKYKLRYIDNLAPRQRAETLAFGSVVHEALQKWYTLSGDAQRLFKVLEQIDAQFPGRAGDATQRKYWHLARAILGGYAACYASEEFDIVALEKEFQAELRDPITAEPSSTLRIAGKVDGIVRVGKELYLLEHKTASLLDGNYLDKLWTDTQIALYCHYLRQNGFPIVGVIYNVLLKARLEQRLGETEEEFQLRREALAAKNKTGRSTAKRQEPETDLEFAARLSEWYRKPEAFHRERIYLSDERLALLQEEVWEIAHQSQEAQRRGKWLLNTSHCFSYGRRCDYLPLCQSGHNEHVRANLFNLVPAHEELAEIATPSF